MKTIQISNKNQSKLSIKARELLAERDVAHIKAKTSNDPEVLREYKNLKNYVNSVIAKEKFSRKAKKFRDEESTLKDKWRKMKSETGQNQFSSPDIIKEGNKIKTFPIVIVNALNRQYIKKIKNTVSLIPQSQTNPLELYSKVVGKVAGSFPFTQISMCQLQKTLSNMKATNSAGNDDISVKILKAARIEIEPILLNMVNSIFKSKKFPDVLKTTKVIPIPKPNKDKTVSDGWRPVNIIPALSKVVERVMMMQINEYLDKNNIVNHSHHVGNRHRQRSWRCMIL